MSLYMKRFVYAALVYLGLAGIFGVINGTTDIGYFGYFAHTHFNLLGFMSMMIFGIGYFILPRFNGSDVRFGSWIPVHFWAGNISLIGMVLFRGLAVAEGSDIYNILFIISAAIQLITIFMFIINIWLSLSPPAKETPVKSDSTELPIAEPASPSSHLPDAAPAAVTVSPNSRIADLVDFKPSVKDLLVREGLKSLDMPGHLDKVRQMGITLGMAASNHGLDLLHLIQVIEHEFASASKTSAARGAQVDSEQLIGEVIENYPNSRPVFEKHFGSGCFDCPGQAYESLDMACRMHGVEPEEFIVELNAALGK